MATKAKAVKAVKAEKVDVSAITAEQRAAIRAEEKASMREEIKAEDKAEKDENGRIRRLPGLNALPINDKDLKNNVIGKGCFGLKSGDSVQWSIVQTADGYRVRYVHGGVYGIDGCTAVDIDTLESIANAYVLEDGNAQVCDAMRKALVTANKAGRAFVAKPNRWIKK